MDAPPQVVRETARREQEAALLPYGRSNLPENEQTRRLMLNLRPDTLRRNANALPVLAAFQEFLEVERRRTRNRLLLLALILLAVVLAVGGAAAFLGLTYYHRAHREVAGLRHDLDDSRSRAEATLVENRRELQTLDRRAGELELAFNRELGQVRTQGTNLDARLEGLGADLTKLRDLMGAIEQAQSSRDALLQEQWSLLSNRLPVAGAPLASMESAPLPVAAAPLPVEPQPAASKERRVIVAILPLNGGPAVDWRIPLP